MAPKGLTPEQKQRVADARRRAAEMSTERRRRLARLWINAKRAEVGKRPLPQT